MTEGRKGREFGIIENEFDFFKENFVYLMSKQDLTSKWKQFIDQLFIFSLFFC